jgi:hypothetical protein
MDLLNRYLNAVAILLPRRERDDIVSEIRETLLSQIEERQGELKRVLSTDDVVALIKDYGHPLAVAGQYRTSRSLIGPALQPFYVLALQTTLGIALLAHVIWASVALALGETPGRVVSFLLSSGWIVGMYLVGACTFSLWILDRLGAVLQRRGVGRWLSRAWTPRHLPPASAQNVGAWARALYELLFLAMVFLWAVGAGLWPAFQPAAPTGELVWLTPAWTRFGQLMIAVALAQVLILAAGAVRPDWVRVRTVGDAAVKLAALGAVGWFVSQRPWFDVSALPPTVGEATSASLDAAIVVGFIPLAVLAATGLALDIARLVQSAPTPAGRRG